MTLRTAWMITLLPLTACSPSPPPMDAPLAKCQALAMVQGGRIDNRPEARSIEAHKTGDTWYVTIQHPLMDGRTYTCLIRQVGGVWGEGFVELQN